MASPYNYIRKLLDRSGRYYDLNEAEAALEKVREKYYGKKYGEGWDTWFYRRTVRLSLKSTTENSGNRCLNLKKRESKTNA